MAVARFGPPPTVEDALVDELRRETERGPEDSSRAESVPCPECGEPLDMTTATSDFPCPWSGALLAPSGATSAAHGCDSVVRAPEAGGSLEGSPPEDEAAQPARPPILLPWMGWFVVGVLVPPLALLGVTLLLLLGVLSKRAQPLAGAALLGACTSAAVIALFGNAIMYWAASLGWPVSLGW